MQISPRCVRYHTGCQFLQQTLQGRLVADPGPGDQCPQEPLNTVFPATCTASASILIRERPLQSSSPLSALKLLHAAGGAAKAASGAAQGQQAAWEARHRVRGGLGQEPILPQEKGSQETWRGRASQRWCHRSVPSSDHVRQPWGERVCL